MNDTVREWVEKAEGDFATGGRELRAKTKPNLDAVCFHAQQCVEKLMKAVIIDRGVVPPKTHDLVALDRILAGLCPSWSWPTQELRLVSRAAVASRYPGESSDRNHATESYELAGRMRRALKALLKRRT